MNKPTMLTTEQIAEIQARSDSGIEHAYGLRGHEIIKILKQVDTDRNALLEHAAVLQIQLDAANTESIEAGEILGEKQREIDALRKYVRHDYSCDQFSYEFTQEPPCNCGLAELLKEK